MALLPELHSVVLLGKKAARAESTVRILCPNALIYPVPHPSPMFVNRSDNNRALILNKLEAVAEKLPQRPDAIQMQTDLSTAKPGCN